MIFHYLKYKEEDPLFNLERFFSEGNQINYKKYNRIRLSPKNPQNRKKNIVQVNKNTGKIKVIGKIYFSLYSDADVGYGKLKSGEPIIIIMSNAGNTLEILIFDINLIDMNLVLDKFELGDFDDNINQVRSKSKKVTK